MAYQHEYQERREPRAPSRPVVMPRLETNLERRMEEYLVSRGLVYGLAVENGWYPCVDRDGIPRIVIPTSSITNSWPYYQARSMGDGEGTKRYVSPAAPRGDALAVVFPSKSPKGSVIVEGPMDALAAAGVGYVGIGLMGNTPNSLVLDHIEQIVKVYGECHVIPDRDAFTQGASVTADLWTRGVRCTLKSITGAKDLAELSPARREALILS